VALVTSVVTLPPAKSGPDNIYMYTCTVTIEDGVYSLVIEAKKESV